MRGRVKTKIIFAVFMIIIWGTYAYSNQVSHYTINIQRPSFWRNHMEPLVIEVKTFWHNTELPTIRTKIFWPMFCYIKEEVWSKAEYYDAFKRPDGKGYISVRATWFYEGDHRFDEVSMHGYGAASYKVENPQGNRIYWSKDGKYFVIASAWEIWEPLVKKKSVYFYEMETGHLAKELKCSHEEFHNLGLLRAE